MVLAYHVILSMYGFWLPNDPRGSWSEFVASRDLYRYGGKATKVEDTRSHAWDKHDSAKRREAKSHLKYPPVALNGAQALAIANGFAEVARSSRYQISACAILPEHIHLVIGRHEYHVEQIVRRLKQAAGLELKNSGLHPFQNETARRGALTSAFGQGMWKCFIGSERYLRSAVKYVDNNSRERRKEDTTMETCHPTTRLAPV